MATGECWLLDTWKKHWVENNSAHTRIHLVIDTAGSVGFWNAVENAVRNPDTIAQHIPYVEDKSVDIVTEQYNAPVVMSPGELDGLVDDIVRDAYANAANDAAELKRFVKLSNGFCLEWRRLWSIYGDSRAGFEPFRNLISSLRLPDLAVLLESNLHRSFWILKR